MSAEADLEHADADHPFARRPHRTLLALSLPVLVSLVAEPLTGLVDTAFVARLGAVPLAALGVAATLVSGSLWVFNFIGTGTQTEVATALGAAAGGRARDAFGVALALAGALGLALAVLAWPLLEPAARLMGADGAMAADAVVYLRIRLLGAPATLAMVASFGALRGLQDMRTPLWIAVASNLLNVVLDALLIFGAGPVPALGIAGAAWASTAAQWLGAGLGVRAAMGRLGRPRRLHPRDSLRLLVIGRDLFVRTGTLIAFLMLGTRVATLAGAESGAANQAIRQVWILFALVLDAYAHSVQSLVGFFLGAGHRALARRAAAVATGWCVATGVAITLVMWAGESWVAAAFVPPAAHAIFASAWWVAALAQPANAVSFVSDGFLLGAGDYRWMRNGMLLATAVGAAGLLAIDTSRDDTLERIQWVTFGWIVLRAVWGTVRIWPGVGASPFRGGSG